MGDNGDDKNDIRCSLPLTVETVSKRQQLATGGNPSGDDFLPFELIIEILWRLPVKFLMKLKCVCKSWNSLISSDRKFAMKHLRVSTLNPKLILNVMKHKQSPKFSRRAHKFSRKVYPLRSCFNNVNGIIDGTFIKYPLSNEDNSVNIVGSCDGILCLAESESYISQQAALWNPSTRKYNLLPYLDHPRLNNESIMFLEGYAEFVRTVYGFGYDHLIDKYKVVAVSMYICYRNFTLQDIQVNVHTSGTNFWRLIQKFPPVTFYNNHLQSGIFVSGTINWLVSDGDQTIVSLDLGTESYQQILYPDQVAASSLVVLRDCLCILARHGGSQMVSDIWLMKEYGNRESWIKLASVPDLGWINNVLYISEDDQVLLEISNDLKSELVVYHPINGTLKIQDSENFNDLMFQGIYVESLISPCS